MHFFDPYEFEGHDFDNIHESGWGKHFLTYGQYTTTISR
jgi:hypothetical protein